MDDGDNDDAQEQQAEQKGHLANAVDGGAELFVPGDFLDTFVLRLIPGGLCRRRTVFGQQEQIEGGDENPGDEGDGDGQQHGGQKVVFPGEGNVDRFQLAQEKDEESENFLNTKQFN